MNLIIQNHTFQYEIEKLVRVFYPHTKITVTREANGDPDLILTAMQPLSDGAKLFVKAALVQKELQKESTVCFADVQYRAVLPGGRRWITGHCRAVGLPSGISSL